MNNIHSEKSIGVAGLLLAGGRSRRMGGGHKCLLNLGGKTLLVRAIERVENQVDELLLNVNATRSEFVETRLPLVSDVIGGFYGPLVGVLTGMLWLTENRPQTRWLATFPIDAPFLPHDLVKRLVDKANEDGVQLACAASDGRIHPPIGLWDTRLALDLRKAIELDGVRKIDLWTHRHSVVSVHWRVTPFDPFFNVNRPKDLQEAEEILTQFTV